ncbi:MAG: hypothetical protein K0R98_1713 [Rickettsiaceae bacterium]|jgi:hypothetical protein|nr:hypothetical protein [Rickettsiaceae bacterium]
MGFSRKRGRPCAPREKTDKGTKELQEKRARNHTIEPLDLCLKKQIIESSEHEAGIRLRWLYTLRFGAPDISAYQPEMRGKSCFHADDEEWLHARHLEYKNALVELEKIGAKRVVINICIFNQRAAFLLPATADTTHYQLRLRHATFRKFKDGMEVLAGVLGKRG